MLPQKFASVVIHLRTLIKLRSISPLARAAENAWLWLEIQPITRLACRVVG